MKSLTAGMLCRVRRALSWDGPSTIGGASHRPVSRDVEKPRLVEHRRRATAIGRRLDKRERAEHVGVQKCRSRVIKFYERNCCHARELSVPENLGQRLAGSVVTRDIMAAGTYAGNPARLLKLAK